MDVRALGAAIDAALALHSLHVRPARIAMLPATAARPLAADVAIFLADHPDVSILGLVVCTQKRLLFILLSHAVRCAKLAPNGLT